VPQRFAVVALVLVIVAGLVASRVVGVSPSAGPSTSDKTSDCGPVGLPARALGLEATRSLTLCLLDEERLRHGLAPLQREVQLDLASQRHSEDMTRRRFFEHVTPEGAAPPARMLAAGYPADNALTGENIAWGEGAKSSPVEIVDMWMHSPGHRENILRPGFTTIGVGVAMDAPRVRSDDLPAATYTTDFGGPPQP
jgi:hypothetical protein